MKEIDIIETPTKIYMPDEKARNNPITKIGIKANTLYTLFSDEDLYK